MNLLNLFFTSKQNTETSRRSQSALLPKKNEKTLKQTKSLDLSPTKEISEAEKSKTLADKFKDCSWGLTYQQNKKTLLLDLDNTLIYASKEIPDIMDYTSVMFEYDGEYLERYVVKRPGVSKFLKKLSKRFNLCVYTAASETYAKKIIEATKISKYIYTLYDRSHCEKTKRSGFLKNIWSLGFEQTQAILIDDLAAQTKHQPHNCLNVKPFTGEASDRELYALYPFLQQLSTVEDIRLAVKNFEQYKLDAACALVQEMDTSSDISEDGSEIEEGCSRSNIRAFECRPTMMRTVELIASA